MLHHTSTQKRLYMKTTIPKNLQLLHTFTLLQKTKQPNIIKQL